LVSPGRTSCETRPARSGMQADRFDDDVQKAPVVVVQFGKDARQTGSLGVAARRVPVGMIPARQSPVGTSQLSSGEIGVEIRAKRHQSVQGSPLTWRQAPRWRRHRGLDGASGGRGLNHAGHEILCGDRTVRSRGKSHVWSGEEQGMGCPVGRRRRCGGRNRPPWLKACQFLLEYFCEGRAA